MESHTAEYRVASTLTNFTPADCDAMNALLRGELSAIETYEQSIPKFEDTAARSVLTRICDEHKQAVEILRTHIQQMGGTPSTGSGVWGSVVTAITGAAKVLGPQTVIGTLQQGEEVGIGTCEALVGDPNVPVECKNLIRSELLPRCQAHVQTLDSLSRSLQASH